MYGEELLSVIVPVHNTPICIFEKCIESIFYQKYQMLDVVVIDDGSEEIFSQEYMSIAHKYLNRMRLFKKTRGGVSSARNLGLEKALGNYVTFLDSDDTLSESGLDSGMRLIEEYKVDFVFGKVNYINGETVNCENQGNDSDTIVAGESIEDVYLAMMGMKQDTFKYILKNAPFAKIFKVDIIRKNHLKFRENLKFSEDAVFNREYCRCISTAAFSKNVWYNYYQFDFSAMHRAIKQDYYNCMIEFWGVWNQLNKTELSENLRKQLAVRTALFEFYDCVRLGIIPQKRSVFKKYTMVKKLFSEDIIVDAYSNISQIKIDNRNLKIRLLLFKLKASGLILASQYLKSNLSRLKKIIYK